MNRRSPFIVASVALVLLAGPARADQAARITEVGWWTSLALTSPPDGGVAVAQNATGTTSIAALRIVVPGALPASAELTLAEADGSVGAADASLQVCPAGSAWKPASGGSMEDAPSAVCERGSAPLTRTDDGSWSADVAVLLDGGEVSLVLLPALTDAPVPATFDVAFAPPVLTTSAAATSAPTTTLSVAAAPAPVASTPAASVHPGPVLLPTVPMASAVVSATEEQVVIGPAVSVPTRRAKPSVPGDRRQWSQALAYLAAAAVAGTLAGASRWQLRTRGLLGQR